MGACWASSPRAPYPRDGRRPLDRVVKKADARDLMRHDRELQRDGELTRAVPRRARRPHGRVKLVKVEGTADGGRTTRLLRRRGTRRLPRPGRDLAQALRTPRRDEADRRPRRDQEAGGVGRAAASCAARRGCASSRPSRSRWRRSRGCRSTRRSSRACAGGSSAACATSTRPTSSCARSAERRHDGREREGRRRGDRPERPQADGARAPRRRRRARSR